VFWTLFKNLVKADLDTISYTEGWQMAWTQKMERTRTWVQFWTEQKLMVSASCRYPSKNHTHHVKLGLRQRLKEESLCAKRTYHWAIIMRTQRLPWGGKDLKVEWILTNLGGFPSEGNICSKTLRWEHHGKNEQLQKPKAQPLRSWEQWSRICLGWEPVAHTYNPSYSVGRDQEDFHSKTVLGK
jgi:hypothetical protein